MITYKVNDEINAVELAEVFKLSGIKRPVEDIQRLEKMIEHADIIITAREKGKVVGVARAITDYHYCCYLSDLAINKEYQGKGIGKKLVAVLKEELGEKVSLILLASEEAMEYYPKIGFDPIDNGFKIGRKA